MPNVAAARHTLAAWPSWSGGGDQQEALGVQRQLLDAASEGLLDPSGQGQLDGHPEAHCQFFGGEAAGQLQQGQRIAPGLLEDPAAYPGIHGAVQNGRQQTARGLVCQSGQDQLGQSGQLVAVVAGGEEHHDRVRRQPAGYEGQDVC
jgi:hypothetical protein